MQIQQVLEKISLFVTIIVFGILILLRGNCTLTKNYHVLYSISKLKNNTILSLINALDPLHFFHT